MKHRHLPGLDQEAFTAVLVNAIDILIEGQAIGDLAGGTHAVQGVDVWRSLGLRAFHAGETLPARDAVAVQIVGIAAHAAGSHVADVIVEADVAAAPAVQRFGRQIDAAARAVSQSGSAHASSGLAELPH